MRRGMRTQPGEGDGLVLHPGTSQAVLPPRVEGRVQLRRHFAEGELQAYRRIETAAERLRMEGEIPHKVFPEVECDGFQLLEVAFLEVFGLADGLVFPALEGMFVADRLHDGDRFDGGQVKRRFRRFGGLQPSFPFPCIGVLCGGGEGENRRQECDRERFCVHACVRWSEDKYTEK